MRTLVPAADGDKTHLASSLIARVGQEPNISQTKVSQPRLGSVPWNPKPEFRFISWEPKPRVGSLPENLESGMGSALGNLGTHMG